MNRCSSHSRPQKVIRRRERWLRRRYFTACDQIHNSWCGSPTFYALASPTGKPECRYLARNVEASLFMYPPTVLQIRKLVVTRRPSVHFGDKHDQTLIRQLSARCVAEKRTTECSV